MLNEEKEVTIDSETSNEKHFRDEPAPPPHFTDEQTKVQEREVCAGVNSWLMGEPASKSSNSEHSLGFLSPGPLCLTHGGTGRHSGWQRGDGTSHAQAFLVPGFWQEFVSSGRISAFLNLGAQVWKAYQLSTYSNLLF